METAVALLYVALGLSSAGSLFTILSLAINTWQIFIDGSLGLWKVCSATCADLPDTYITSSVMGTRAMVFLGMFLMIATASLIVLFIFVMKGNEILLLIAAGTAFMSGFFLMIGFAIYADKLKVPGSAYGGAFGLCVLAWLMSWVIAALLAVAKKMKSGGALAPST